MYRIDNWINEGSALIVELIKSHYINISTYRPLSGSPYIKLLAELRSLKKGSTNIKNNYQKCFFWCHVRHMNLIIIHPVRITREDKKLVNDLDYHRVEFYVSDQKFENSMDLLIVTDCDKSHYVYIKDFDRFMFHKTKNKDEKYFCKICLQCFSSKNVLTKHKEVCLFSGVQSVKLERGTIEF